MIIDDEDEDDDSPDAADKFDASYVPGIEITPPTEGEDEDEG